MGIPVPSMSSPRIVVVDGIEVEFRSSPPFIARPARDGADPETTAWPWYVAGPDGRRNVVSFGRGRVLCGRDEAKRVADFGNNLDWSGYDQ